MTADVLVRLAVLVVIAAFIAAVTVWYRRRSLADAARRDERWPAVPADVLSPDGAGSGWVIFTTPVCASCRQVEAALHRDRPSDRVVLVDATIKPDLAERYEVRRAPTTLAVDGAGRVQARLVGVEDVLDHLRRGSRLILGPPAGIERSGIQQSGFEREGSSGRGHVCDHLRPMTRYTMLTHPGTNRVYAKDAPALALAEVRTVTELLPDHGFGEPVAVERAGASFVDVEAGADQSAGTRDPATESVLAALASTFALFIVHGDLLEPIEAPVPRRFGDDLLTILKYPGKTNEQFTALLLRLALAASRPAGAGTSGYDAWLEGEPLRVLDPLCGRGTTLNQALRDGCDAIGIDADRKDIEAYLSFLARYLETNRIKHRRDTARPAPDGRRTLRTTYTITPRGAGDPNQRPLTLDIINDDTRFIRDHIKGSSAHVVVADLPYGIQHGSRADARGESRNPAVLLAEALPVWRGVLRGGGAIALSYNTKVIGRDEVDAALAEVDLVVVESLADGRFSHRVDQSIQRDISLATKPA